MTKHWHVLIWMHLNWIHLPLGCNSFVGLVICSLFVFFLSKRTSSLVRGATQIYGIYYNQYILYNFFCSYLAFYFAIPFAAILLQISPLWDQQRNYLMVYFLSGFMLKAILSVKCQHFILVPGLEFKIKKKERKKERHRCIGELIWCMFLKCWRWSWNNSSDSSSRRAYLSHHTSPAWLLKEAKKRLCFVRDA